MDDFTLVGAKPQTAPAAQKAAPWYKSFPFLPAAVLGVIVLGCLFSGVFLTKDPGYMDLARATGSTRFSCV